MEEDRISDVERLHLILCERSILFHGVTLYNSEDTLKIVEIAKRHRLQLAEIDYFLLHDDGRMQPSYSNDISVYNHTFEEIREKVISYGENSYFELLDIEDLLES